MNDMINRVAKSLFEYDQNREFNSNLLLYGAKDKVTWEFINSPEVIAFIGDDYRHKARAAIEAMREPTQDMITAYYESNYGDPVPGWQAMIDKALM